MSGHTAAVYLATHSPHKWYLKQLALELRRNFYQENYNLSLAVLEPLVGNTRHISADEIGNDRRDNGIIKLNETWNDVQRLMPGGEQHEWSLAMNFRNGIWIPNHHGYIHAADDSTSAFLRPVAENLIERLDKERIAPADLLPTESYNYDGRQYIDFTKLSDILRAAGTNKFWQITIEEAEKLNLADDPRLCVEYVTVLARSATAQKHEKPEQFDAEIPFNWRTRNMPAPVGRLQSMDLLTRGLMDSDKRSIDNFGAFFASHQYNAQLVVMDQLFKFAAHCATLPPHVYLGYDSVLALNNALTKYGSEHEPLFVVQPAEGELLIGGKPLTKLGQHNIVKAGFKHNTPEEKEGFHLAKSMRFKGDKTPDVVIMPPFDVNNENLRILNYARSNDATVAKQTELHNLLIIYQNLVDEETGIGCWDDHLDSTAANSNMTLNGNFPINAMMEAAGFDPDDAIARSALSHEGTYYFHEIKGSNSIALASASNLILKHHIERLNRKPLFDFGKPRMDLKGFLPPEGMPSVVVYTSHNCPHVRLNEDIFRFTKHQGDKGRNLVTGGGRLPAMVTAANGYKAARNGKGGPHLTCATTNLLEAIEGGMIKCDLAIRYELIADRLGFLDTGILYRESSQKQSNDIRIKVLFGCGDGGDQEQFEKLRNDIVYGLRPNDFLVIYNPPYMDKSATHMAALGRNMFNGGQVNHEALARKNIYYTTSCNGLLNITDQLAENSFVASPIIPFDQRRGITRASLNHTKG